MANLIVPFIFIAIAIFIYMTNLITNKHIAFLKGELYRQQVINRLFYNTEFGSQEWHDCLMEAYKPSIDDMTNAVYKNKKEAYKFFQKRFNR